MTKKLTLAALLAMFALPLAACGDDDAGDELEDAAEEVADDAEDAADEMEDAVDPDGR